jgi:poly-gamma-glutamate synthesis protein (capsule biosynthesis protein)
MKFTLAATGDLIIAGRLHDASRGIYRHLESADCAIGNLEVVLTSSAAAADKLIALKAPPPVANQIAAAGFRLLSLANNHAMDFGAPGLADSISAVREAGMVPVGAGPDLAASLHATIVQHDAFKIAFLGVATTLPNGSAAGPSRPGVAPVRVISRYVIDSVTFDEAPGMSPFVETQAVSDDVAALCERITEAASCVDRVVVNIHWGAPLGWIAGHQGEIAQYQPALAHAMIDAGASAVIGHHPHLIQAAEYYRGAPILYSLGNFIMHHIIPDSIPGITAHPSYDWSTLKTRWNSLGCIARLVWSVGSETPECLLLVTKLDDLGEPTPAPEADAIAVYERIVAQSRLRNCEISVEKYSDLWALRLTSL